MQTLLIELRDKFAFEELQNLEAKKFIRIVTTDEGIISYALPGKSISVEDFRNWVDYAESTPTVSLKDAKKQWERQKKKLQKLTL